MQFIATTKYYLHNLYHYVHINIIAAPAHACSMHLFLTIYIQVSVIKCSYTLYIPALTPANVGSSLQSLTQEFWQNCLVASAIASASLASAICVFEK